ncbi:MAG: YbjQ family protein [Defluviitaleaceae bacterium]|nr:YbjQ family protein [Defluviitaleaceae bacterium]
MLLVTAEHIPGKTLKYLGLVSCYKVPLNPGTIVSSKTIDKAKKLIVEDATALGADAIISIRWIFNGNQVFVYGTAVKYED